MFAQWTVEVRKWIAAPGVGVFWRAAVCERSLHREPQRLGFPEIGGFEVTDATSLNDGTLLVLERRFRWTEGVKMRIRRFAPDQVKAGALMQGDTLIEADLAAEIDNMEGLTWHRSARGEIILTLISDDNFNHFLQRTILLQFALIDEGKAAAVKP